MILLLLSVASASRAQIFVGDFESGKLEEEKWLRDAKKGYCGIDIVKSPVRSGRFSARFSADEGVRCEVVPWIGSTIFGRLTREPFGEDRWYGFSVLLPDGWQPNERNEVIAQWHSSADPFFGEDGRGPPLALRTVDENWYISYGWDADLVSTGGRKARYEHFRGPFETGQWTDWVFHVKWSYEDDGLTEIWKNGELLVRYEGPNCYNDFRGIYLKLGVYHPGEKRVVYHDELRYGDKTATYDTVVPPGSRLTSSHSDRTTNAAD